MLKSLAVGLASVVAGASAQAVAGPASDWNGFYVNGGVGYGSWTSKTTTVNYTTGACVLCTAITQGGRGVSGNLGAGYDHALNNPKLIIGGFANYSVSDVKGSIQDQGPFYVADAKLDHSWNIGARLGWLATPSTLGYIDAGYTQGHFKSGEATQVITGLATGTHYTGFNTDGGFGGVGVEQALTGNWSLRGDYQIAKYGSDKFANCLDSTGVCGGESSITFDPWVQTFKVNVVYKFKQ